MSFSEKETLGRNGISETSTEDEFFCHICKVSIFSLHNVEQHAKGKQHIKNLEAKRNTIQKKNETITANVESKELKSGNQQSSTSGLYTTLLKNSVYKDRTVAYRCSLCGSALSDYSSAVDHVKGKSHQKYVSHNSLVILDSIEQISENESKHLVENWVCLKDAKLFCNLCKCSMTGLICALQHIRGHSHKDTVKKILKTPPSNSVKRDGNKGKPQNTCADKAAKKLQDANWYSKNFITAAKKSGEFQCTLCSIKLSGIHPCIDHVAGSLHQNTLKTVAKINQVVKSAINHEKIQSNGVGASSSSHPETLLEVPKDVIPLIKKHHLQHLPKKMHCVACNIDMMDRTSIISHTSSQKHENKLFSYREQLREEIIINIMKSKSMKALIAKHPLKVNKSEINCLPCGAILLNENSLQSHVQSVKHLKQLERIKKNRLVYEGGKIYCSLCSATMYDEQCVETHINGMRHLTNSSKGKGNNGSTTSSNTSSTSLSTKLQTLRETKKSVPNTPTTKTSKSITKGVNNITKELKTLDLNKKKLTRVRIDRRTRKKRTGLSPKYLGFDMQHIYDINPERRRQIKASCQLNFPKTDKTIYCLVCEKSISNQLQAYYEHICSVSHLNYLSEMEQDDLCFEKYREQFSDLALAKEFIQEISEELVQCFACDVKVQNEDAQFHEHIATDVHKQKAQRWKEAGDKIMKAVLLQVDDNWYNVQKYWCQPCNVEFGSEIGFAEHLENKEHKVKINALGPFQERLIFDSCAPCALLWIGYPGIYSKHCEQKVHRYLVSSGDYMIGEMPRLAKILLDYAEKEVMDFIAKSDRVLLEERRKADILLESLEDAVRHRYPDARAHAFGSRVSGLSLPGSDIDVFLDCGDMYDGTKFTEARQDELIKTVRFCLSKDKKTWEIEEVITASRTPIIKLRHRETDLRCDVSFKNGLSVENTKLLKCYIELYPPCRMVILLMKKWLTMCKLSGSHSITNYAICWYVIFYLQWKEILPSVAELIAMKNESKIIAGWESGVCHEFIVENSDYTFLELLHGFFEFYAEFDYRFQVACPLLGETIEKQSFATPEDLPEEMAPYINHVQTSKEPELFRIDSAMCIQDPFDLSHNLTKAVRKFTLNHFRQFCAFSAEILSEQMETE